MNDDVRLERLLEDGLHDLAPARAPNRLSTQVMAETGEVRPRARWLALIKEPPMRTNSRLVAGSPTARAAAVMAATLLLVVMLATAGIAGSQILAAEGPIIVDQSGNGHHETIQAAVDAAEAGDEIAIRPGTYAEAVVIGKDVSVRGDGPREAIVITAPQEGPTALVMLDRSYQDPYALLLMGTEASISGLTFRGESAGVIASGGAPTLENILFDGTGITYDGTFGLPGGNSVIVNQGSAAVIRGNTFADGGPIGVFGASSPHILDNTLTGGPHIYGLGWAEGSVVGGNTIESVVARGIGMFDSSEALLIESNVFRDVGRIAIEVQAGEATIIGNTIEGAGADGISIRDKGSAELIEDNQVTDAGATGITVYLSEPVLRDNTIRNAKTGVSWGGDDGAIVGNVISDTGVGLLITRGSPDVRDNVVEGATNRGISISRDAAPALTGNQTCSNGEGLFVAAEAAAVIDDTNVNCEGAPAE